MSLRFVRLTPKAHAPVKGSELAAGVDLKSAYAYEIQPRSREIVKTDLQIAMPDGCYGRIASRSGITWKFGIEVGAGVIDADYRGDIKIILFNHSDELFKIKSGDRIAQLVCEKIVYPKLEEVVVGELNETVRGSDGLGSTGII